MGKFLKTCLILGVICIAAGIAASSAGIFNGGLSDLKEQVLSGEWSVDLGDWDLDVDPFFELEEQHYFDDNEKLTEGVESREDRFATSDIWEIKVKSAGVTVEFTEHDGEEILVNISKVNQYQGYVKGNALHITVRGQDSQSLGSGIVQILIPAALYEAGNREFTVESAASAINFNKIAAADVELNVSAGTISWSEMTAGELSIEMSAGTVNGADTVITGETDIDLKAGTVEFSGILGRENGIDMAAGMANIALNDAYTDYNYDISCAGGSVKVGEQTSEGLAKSMEIDNRAAKEIDIECSMGAVNITFAN